MIVDELTALRDKLIVYLSYRRIEVTGSRTLNELELNACASLYEEISISAGKYGQLIKECSGLDTIKTSSGLDNVWDWALSLESNTLVYTALDRCVQATGRTIGRVTDDIARGTRDEQGTPKGDCYSVDNLEPPKAFIAHGGRSEARDRLCRFLTALGIVPLVIEEEPKQNRSVNQQVDYYLERADCAIVLGTADDEDLKDGKLYPRRNVAVEIGRFQERFPGKMIFLLEEGASFPSNISEKVYTSFVHKSMDEAFIAVATELKAFGMLRVVKL